MSQHGCPERLSNRSKGFQEDGSGQQTMEVLVETLTGTAFEMTVSPSDTVFAIKSKIFRVEGIPISQQHLLYQLRELEDAASLRELGVGEGARLRLVLGMRGGPVATRRLPPARAEPWPDIERLLDSNREDGDWGSGSGSGSGSGAGGCKVTVLVFRDGERVNMLRVQENRDGTYSPLDHAKYSSLSQAVEPEQARAPSPLPAARRDNELTQHKMRELRRRMDALSLQRHPDTRPDKVDIQKTRSEESLLRARYGPGVRGYDGLAERFSLPPLISPIARPNRGRSDEDLKLSETLAGSILVKKEGTAILEECLDGEPCGLSDSTLAEYGGRGAWGAHSASSLQLRAPLSDALFSASTSELEKLQRNSRILPALSRHRNRSHLHLSDEGLHMPRTPAPEPLRLEETAARDKKRVRCARCRKRLSVASTHTCRCGAALCAPHRYSEAHACRAPSPRLPDV